MKGRLLRLINKVKCFFWSLLKDLKLSTFKEIRRTLIFTLTVIVGLIIGTLLNSISFDVFLIKTVLGNIAFQVTYVFFLLVLIAFFIVAIFKYKYRLSYWETIGFIFVFAVYRGISTESLKAFQFEPWGVNVFIPFCIILPTLFVGLLVNANWPFDKRSSDNNTFLEDNPINPEELKEDSTYNHLISKIAPALFKDVYKSSFSIGVIGPWGTGKSSFLRAVKHEVYEASETSLEDFNKKYKANLDKKPDTIFIEFSPFLNHNEEQVIHEFFTQLSNQLSERSGRLSNLITIYSEKLANIADKNPWFSLFKIARNSRENRSAQELYADIKDCIKELDVKIIVTVDDLDRLNAKEILQVLKLIRNTSNFPNMVFLVALDKEYVMKTLGKQNDYSYREYIDKFFQIELNLKEPDYNEINSYFIEQIIEANILDEKNLDELQNALETKDNVSISHIISNYRSSIKIVNQILIDYDKIPNLFIEINPRDYLKFLYIKASYPRFYKKLVKDPEKYLSMSNGYFTLKEKNPTRIEGEAIKDKKLNEAIVSANKGTFNLEFEHFEFGEELENTQSEIIFNSNEASLIKLIFSEIFNSTSGNPNSIQKVSNFYKLARFQLDESEINEVDFSNIILKTKDSEEEVDFIEIIDEFKLLNKSNKLVKRLESYVNQDKNIHLNLIKLHFILLSRHQIFNDEKTFYLLLSSLEKFMEINETKFSEDKSFRFFRDIEASKTELKQILKEFWIENGDVSNGKRFDLILSLKENRFIETLWTKYDFEELAIYLFKKYLSDYAETDWEVDDFKFFSYLRSLKEEVNQDKIIEVVKEHFENAPFESLCRQIIHADFQSSKYIYGILDLIPVMFGSYGEFYDYIEPKISKRHTNSINFNKFLHLLKHFIIINENSDDKTTYYVAEKFNGWLEREEEKLGRRGNFLQLTVEIHSKKLQEQLSSNIEWYSIISKYRINQIIRESKKFSSNYVYLTLPSDAVKNIKTIDTAWIKLINNNFEVDESTKIELLNSKELKEKNGTKIYELISVEPSNLFQ